MSEPLVSVLIPAYNHERFLGEALDSVEAQDYAPLEVLVVDDGSSDGTAEVAEARGVPCLRRPHRGIAATRNAAVAASRGELVAFLDADDVWPERKLETQVGYLAEHPEVDVALGHMQFFVEPGTTLPEWFPLAYLREPQRGLLDSMVARRRAIGAVGHFDESFEVGEDTDWIARAKDSGVGMAMLPDVCVRYRIHGGNITHRRRDAMAGALARVIRASVHRQRQWQ